MPRGTFQDEEMMVTSNRRHSISCTHSSSMKKPKEDIGPPGDFNIEPSPPPILEAPIIQEQQHRWQIARMYPLIPGRLSFTVHLNESMTIKEIKTRPDLFFFSCDCQDRYESYCWDFGPVNIGVVHTFCEYMRSKLDDPRLSKKHLVYYADIDAANRTNAAFLLSAFLLIEHKMTPDQAVRPFTVITPSPFISFRDASNTPSTYDLSFVSCINGLHRALDAGWYCPATFSLDKYEAMEHPEMDLHVICPKFVAFRGPRSASKQQDKKSKCHAIACSPSLYIKPLKEYGVRAVVRLNEPGGYSPREFVDHGIAHTDLFFEDCTCPSDHVLEQFLDLADECKHGRLGVHCFAGLGRTGTLIAAWIMKHHQFTADEAIGWLRLCRPGSVIGPQQQYLAALEGVQWQGNRPVRSKRRSLAIGSGDHTQAVLMAKQFAEAHARRNAKR